MTKHPTAAEKRATRDAERKAEMDEAFDREVRRADYSEPADQEPAPESKIDEPAPAAEPADPAALPGQVQRRMATMRAVAEALDCQIPGHVLQAMALALEPKA